MLLLESSVTLIFNRSQLINETFQWKYSSVTLLLDFNSFCLLDYLQHRSSGSTLYGFKGGPAGIMKCKYIELKSDYITPYRNQVLFFSRLQVFGM